MKRNGIVSWDLGTLKSIKRDLLFFDNFYYDELLLKLNLLYIESIVESFNLDDTELNEIYSTVEYLKSLDLLKSYNIANQEKDGTVIIETTDYTHDNVSEIIDEYNSNHKLFHKRIKLILKDANLDIDKTKVEFVNLYKDLQIFNDHHVRLNSIIFNTIESDDVAFPLVKQMNNLKHGKKFDVIKIVIGNLPVPDNQTPIDEILSFKNNSSNKSRYMGLLNWINKVSNSSYSVKEIKEELEYYTIEYEQRLKLEKARYTLSNFEAVITLPIEIAEKIVKLQWSKIPESILKFKRNKISLMIAETKAPGREIAYISNSKEKFKNNAT